MLTNKSSAPVMSYARLNIDLRINLKAENPGMFHYKGNKWRPMPHPFFVKAPRHFIDEWMVKQGVQNSVAAAKASWKYYKRLCQQQQSSR